MPGDKKAALSRSPESIAAKKKKRERFTNQKVDINRVEQVRDCGVQAYQTTPTNKRATTLQICSKTLIGAILC